MKNNEVVTSSAFGTADVFALILFVTTLVCGSGWLITYGNYSSEKEENKYRAHKTDSGLTTHKIIGHITLGDKYVLVGDGGVFVAVDLHHYFDVKDGEKFESPNWHYSISYIVEKPEYLKRSEK